MESPKSKEEYRDKFVKDMLEKAEKDDKPTKPQNVEADPKEVADILKRIQKNIQEKR